MFLSLRNLALGCAMFSCFSGFVQAQNLEKSAQSTETTKKLVKLDWHTDYLESIAEAKEDAKMLLLLFSNGDNDPIYKAFEEKSLSDPQVREDLQKYVLVKLPVDVKVHPEEEDEVTLLEHASFEHMHKKQGVAIIDFENEDTELYGRVVSAFPFTNRTYYSPKAMKVILNLPPGTVTQRTMIYAVRTHPEAPKSTLGTPSKYLKTQASSHSQHQADIQVQGHHNWNSRFHTINGHLPGGLLAQEVVAESWGGEPLVDAAKECVHSWRQSPGHWSAVRGFHKLFGYDIKKGRNGVWYATGIFATHD